MELQAEDRVHRIGQKKQVVIYKFVTKDSFEERVQIAAEKKLMLDHVVIAKKESTADSCSSRLRSGRKKLSKEEEKLSLTELWSALKHGAKNVFHSAGNEDVLLSDAELDNFIDKVISPTSDYSSAAMSSAHGIEDTEKVEVEGVNTIFDLVGRNSITEDHAVTTADSEPEGSDYRELLPVPAIVDISNQDSSSGSATPLENAEKQNNEQVGQVNVVDSPPRKRARAQPKRFVQYLPFRY